MRPAKINYVLKDAEGYLPHNVTIAGNPGAVLAFRQLLPALLYLPSGVEQPAPVDRRWRYRRR